MPKYLHLNLFLFFSYSLPPTPTNKHCFDKIQKPFWLRMPKITLSGCVKPCMLNDLCALTLQHNVILSTNSMSCQSETMSPVNCFWMPQKLHSQVKTTRGQWIVERHQIPCQDYSILFLISTKAFNGETGRRRQPTPEVSVMSQPCKNHAEDLLSSNAWENKLKQFSWNLNSA